MTVYINGVAQLGSKVIWWDVTKNGISDNNRTASLDWADLDLSSQTSPNAKFAILNLNIRPDVIGTGNDVELRVRKKGTAPGYFPRIQVDKEALAGRWNYQSVVIVGLDANKVIEYMIAVSTGWTIDSGIRVLGYIE